MAVRPTVAECARRACRCGCVLGPPLSLCRNTTERTDIGGPSPSKGRHHMAQKVHITLEDDLDGGEATETVSFGLDGRTYEIDLNDKNAAALRDALARYVAAARRSGGRSRHRGQAPYPGGHQRPRDPRLGPLQRSQGARPRPDPGRRARGLRSRSLREQPSARYERPTWARRSSLSRPRPSARGSVAGPRLAATTSQARSCARSTSLEPTPSARSSRSAARLFALGGRGSIRAGNT